MKTVKIILIVSLVLILVIAIALIGAGNYFVSYAISRTGDSGSRDEVEEVVLDNELKNKIAQKENLEKKIAKEWTKTIKSKEVIQKTTDNLNLKATEYIQENDTEDWVIVCHGYHSKTDNVLPSVKRYYEKGYNVLVPHMRAHGESEGKYIGMGWLDKEDVKGWIKLLEKEYKEVEITLHGFSMGAATVLMAAGDTLSSSVQAIVADSAYTSVWDIFASEAKLRFNIPTFPVMDVFRMVAINKAKYDPKEASTLEQVKKIKLPVLFIHGANDSFITPDNCDKLFENATCKKEKVIIEGANHTEGQYANEEKYYNAIFNFLENIE